MSRKEKEREFFVVLSHSHVTYCFIISICIEDCFLLMLDSLYYTLFSLVLHFKVNTLLLFLFCNPYFLIPPHFVPFSLTYHLLLLLECHWSHKWYNSSSVFKLNQHFHQSNKLIQHLYQNKNLAFSFRIRCLLFLSFDFYSRAFNYLRTSRISWWVTMHLSNEFTF